MAYNKSGYSTIADEEGAVNIKTVDEHLVRLPPEVQAKCYKKFYFEHAYRKGKFPNDIAKAKAYKNLSSRYFTVFLFGNSQYVDQAGQYEVLEIIHKEDDYNVPPELRTQIRLRQTGVRTDCASMDWNPIKDAKWIYNWWKEKAKQECLALNYDPSKYGL